MSFNDATNISTIEPDNERDTNMEIEHKRTEVLCTNKEQKKPINQDLSEFLITNLELILKQQRPPSFCHKKYSKMNSLEIKETQKYVYSIYKQIRIKAEKKINGFAEAYLEKIRYYFLHKSFPISIKNMQKCCQDKIRFENTINESSTNPTKMEKKITKLLGEDNDENLKKYIELKNKCLFKFLKNKDISEIKNSFPSIFKVTKKVGYLDIIVSKHLDISIVEKIEEIWSKIKNDSEIEDEEVVPYLCQKLKTYRKKVDGIVSQKKENKKVYIYEKTGGKMYVYNSGIKMKVSGVLEAIELYVLHKILFKLEDNENDCRFFSIFYSYCKLKPIHVLRKRRHVYPIKSVSIAATYL